MDHFAVARVPAQCRAVPHPKLAIVIWKDARIGQAERINRVRAKKRCPAIEPQAETRLDHQTSDISAPMAVFGVLPAHEQHVMFTANPIASADADAVGIVSSGWPIFEKRAAISNDDFPAQQIDVDGADG